MRPSEDDLLLTPEARLRELAGILAMSIVRRLRRPAISAPARVEGLLDEREESSSTRLEVPDKTVLSVHTS